MLSGKIECSISFFKLMNAIWTQQHLAYPEKDLVNHADQDQKQKSAEQTDVNTDKSRTLGFLWLYTRNVICFKIQLYWWGFISRNYVVCPSFFLMNVFIALKGSLVWFLFAFTATGIVQCGDRKTSPRTSTIVQFIFCFWSFEDSEKSEINDWFRLTF